MADASRLAELISEDFYEGGLNFGARRPGSDDWSNLPEVEATDRMPPTDAAVATDGLRDDGVTGPTRRLFLTFVAAVDKMRDATQLWRAAGELFRTNPEVFDPAEVSSMSLETLRKLLSESRVTRYPERQAGAWRTIAASLAAGNGPVCRVVDSGYGDAVELLKDVRSRDRQGQARFPELRGDEDQPDVDSDDGGAGQGADTPPGHRSGRGGCAGSSRDREPGGDRNPRPGTQQQDQEGDSERLVRRRRHCQDRWSGTDRRNLLRRSIRRSGSTASTDAATARVWGDGTPSAGPATSASFRFQRHRDEEPYAISPASGGRCRPEVGGP